MGCGLRAARDMCVDSIFGSGLIGISSAGTIGFWWRLPTYCCSRVVSLIGAVHIGLVVQTEYIFV